MNGSGSTDAPDQALETATRLPHELATGRQGQDQEEFVDLYVADPEATQEFGAVSADPGTAELEPAEVGGEEEPPPESAHLGDAEAPVPVSADEPAPLGADGLLEADRETPEAGEAEAAQSEPAEGEPEPTSSDGGWLRRRARRLRRSGQPGAQAQPVAQAEADAEALSGPEPDNHVTAPPEPIPALESPPEAELVTEAPPEAELVAEAPPEAELVAEPTPEPGFRQRSRIRHRARYLRALREVQLRDIGGLVLELHRFGRERPDLIQAKVIGAVETDSELRALERALGRQRPLRELREAGIGGACEQCGAVHGSTDRYCASCGEPLLYQDDSASGTDEDAESDSP